MLLQSIRLASLLSFDDASLDFRPLNVLIGPNASGKSNLIAALGLLKAAPNNFEAEISRGGGVRQWLSRRRSNGVQATIEASLDIGADGLVRYRLAFDEKDQRPRIALEEVSSEGQFYVQRAGARVGLYQPTAGYLQGAEIAEAQSVMAVYRNPADQTPVTKTGRMLGSIEIFHEFDTGLNSSVRNGVAAGTQKDFLYDGGGNLALVLQELDFRGKLGRANEFLKRLWEEAEEIKVRLEGGTAQTYIRERGVREPMPATRLSDGTLRLLCLMAVLLHPELPPLICIEEPELGLHPDALSIVADLLREAAQRCQLIVTTHSDALVSALSDDPESVVVCERGQGGGTQFRRLQSKDLDEWLERYSLGDLWRKGEIGGNRW
jgi:predicted ATPase